jgi:hypothetical protein
VAIHRTGIIGKAIHVDCVIGHLGCIGESAPDLVVVEWMSGLTRGDLLLGEEEKVWLAEEGRKVNRTKSFMGGSPDLELPREKGARGPTVNGMASS